jgi:outer membrane protein assembly factor BamA
MIRSVLRIVFILVLILSSVAQGWAGISVIPLPAVSSSRNEGVTAGNLTVLLYVNDTGIYRILAPMITYNPIIGTNLSITWLEYLGEGKDLSLVLSQSVGIDQEYTLNYRNLTLKGGKIGLETRATFYRDSTYRFFGFTDLSSKEDETNFTQREIGYQVSVRFQPIRTFRVSLSQSLHDVDIGTGRVNDLPFIGELFPGIPGARGATVLGHRLTLTYDSRDLEATPLVGSFVTLYTEINRNFEEGNDRYFSGTLLDARVYLSSPDGRFSTATRGALFITGGHRIPFFEQATLGGQDSLRDFGKNRFIDDNLILFNLEERIRIFTVPLFGVIPEFQLAPFIDVGQVFSNFRKIGEKIQINPGIGIRGIVRPNVVGRIDLGFGREGVTIFVGVDFPF